MHFIILNDLICFKMIKILTKKAIQAIQSEWAEGVIKIGYSYGLTTSAINQFSSGTHEIALNYCMKILKPAVVTKSKNPRFL